MKQEIWRDIKGYEGLYQVSNFERIKSLPRNTTKGGILKQATDGRYNVVSLMKDGKKENKLVHILVANAFVPNPNNYSEVNHKDENKLNNYAGTPENNFTDGNLEWCTHQYNCDYGTRNKRITSKQRNRIKDSKPVLQYDLQGNFIKEWPSMAEIKRQLKISKSCISYCCDGKIKTSHNYVWKWKQ